MNTNLPTPYLLGKIFHFRYTDSSGKRHRQSTGMTRKSDAQRYIREFMDKLRSGVDSSITVREILSLYKDPQTNPKWKQSLVILEHLFNYWYIYTNAEKDAKTALETYRERNGIEVFFDDLKNELDCERLRFHSSRAMYDRLFIQFIAIILLSAIRKVIVEKGERFSKYATSYRDVPRRVNSFSIVEL